MQNRWATSCAFRNDEETKRLVTSLAGMDWWKCKFA